MSKNATINDYRTLEENGTTPEDIIRRAREKISRSSTDTDEDYLKKLIKEIRVEKDYVLEYNRENITTSWSGSAIKISEEQALRIGIGAPASMYIFIILAAIIASFFNNYQSHSIDPLVESLFIIGAYSLFIWISSKYTAPQKQLANKIFEDITVGSSAEGVRRISNYFVAFDTVRAQYRIQQQFKK